MSKEIETINYTERLEEFLRNMLKRVVIIKEQTGQEDGLKVFPMVMTSHNISQNITDDYSSELDIMPFVKELFQEPVQFGQYVLQFLGSEFDENTRLENLKFEAVRKI